MLIKYLSVAAIGAALMTAPALAQMETKSGTASSAGLWQASKLVRMNVYNQQNEKIGDIQELMLDKSGKIDSVVIGVGGFLGMGQHDVAIKFSDLQWSDQPVPPSSPSPATTGANSGMAGGGAAASRQVRTNPTYPNHAILANASKDQLKAMPQFEYKK